MTLIFYGHPFSSYCQKGLIALHEHALPFDFRMVTFADTPEDRDFYSLWPMKRMPVLVDGGKTFIESSIIVEQIDRKGTVPKLIPTNPDLALEVRMLDRIFDNYVMTPMARIVSDHLRPPESRDPYGSAEARKMLDAIYDWLDRRLGDGPWAIGEAFTLADCAAGPALFYADWVHDIPARFANLRAYRARLNARPSFAKAIDGARPYRKLFPPGAPDRD